jgi:type IV secretion system protein VirB10
MAPQVATSTDPSTVTIPAGTRVLMVLKSPLHTTSGTAGSGLYLETLYPVVQGNGVVIPARTLAQGVVESDERPGHLKRTSEFRFRFTSLIFPNNLVVPITGALQSIPGARNIRTRADDRTLKPVDQTEKVVTPAAASAVGGAIIGSQRGFGIGLLPGAGLGAALGLGAVLLKRGDEIYLPQGSRVEMVLQAPFNLEQAQIAANARYVRPSQSVTDTPQPASIDDGTNRRKHQRAAFGTINPFKILVP